VCVCIAAATHLHFNKDVVCLSTIRSTRGVDLALAIVRGARGQLAIVASRGNLVPTSTDCTCLLQLHLQRFDLCLQRRIVVLELGQGVVLAAL
jgi:hypothetical protein